MTRFEAEPLYRPLHGDASSAELLALADHLPHLVWTAGDDGVVNYYNARVRHYAGVVEEDGTYRWEPLVHEDDLDRTLAEWSAAVSEGRPYEAEHRIQMADGSYRWHVSRAVPIRRGGEVLWFGTATDVHERRIAQERVQEVASTLQQALLPARLSDGDGYSLGAVYRPSRPSASPGRSS
jgi:PAS domain S-box-containing protein